VSPYEEQTETIGKQNETVMKKIALLAAIPLFALLATPARAIVTGASGPATFNVTASA
jgi:hypothetical protein